MDTLVIAFVKGKYCVIEDNWILYSSNDDQSARRYYYSCKRNPDLKNQSHKRQLICFDNKWYSKAFWIDGFEELKDRYGEYTKLLGGFIITVVLSMIISHYYNNREDMYALDNTTMLNKIESLSADTQDHQVDAPGNKTPSINKKNPEQLFHPIIIQAAHRYHVDPSLIKAIIMAESSYNPKAVSKVGAQGLMQLMPNTAKELGVKDSFDPEQNIDGGVRYFKKLLDKYHGDKRLALAAYNAGSAKVKRYRGVPPFKATRIYIKKVCKYEKKYKKQMSNSLTKA